MMYVAEVFNKTINEDGDLVITDEFSMLHELKSDAEMFLATAPQSEKFLTEVANTCGCLEDGDKVALMMGITSDNITAYCEWCA